MDEFMTYLLHYSSDGLLNFQRNNEREKKEKDAFINNAPFKLEHVEFDEKKLKHFNLHNTDNMFYICDKNYKRLFDNTIFKVTNAYNFLYGICHNGKYQVLDAYRLDTYSKDIAKTYKLKSPYHYWLNKCVIDTENLTLIYISKEKINDYICVYGNIMVRSEKDKVVYLPTLQPILTDYRTCFITKENLVFNVETDFKTRTEKLKIVNKESGEITEIP